MELLGGNLEGCLNQAKTLAVKEKRQLLGGEPKRTSQGEGGGTCQMTENRGQKTEDYKRCQAITTKGFRCKKEAACYRIYEGDKLEYLSCKLHLLYFTPHRSQKGQQPPEEE